MVFLPFIIQMLKSTGKIRLVILVENIIAVIVNTWFEFQQICKDFLQYCIYITIYLTDMLKGLNATNIKWNVFTNWSMFLVVSATSQFHVDNVNIQFHQTYVSNKYVMRNHASNASNLKFWILKPMTLHNIRWSLFWHVCDNTYLLYV